MTVQELAERLDKLMQQGYSQLPVCLDTCPDTLFMIGGVDIETEERAVIIWKE